MGKKLYFVLILAVSLLGDTVSGVELSEGEKLIFQNKRDITKLKLKLSSLREDIDGIKSVLDSMGAKVSSPKSDKNLKNQLDELSIRVDKIERDNKQRFKKIEKSIDKILALLSKKNQNKSDKKTSKLKQKKDSKTTKKIKILSVSEIAKNADSFYKQKKYKEARDSYLDLADKKYKLARTYFYIAQTLFFQKRYKEAIVYYKKSVNSDDNSKFLPKLLLNSGLSFKNMGDKTGAKRFFDSLIGAYPNSKEAKLAKNYLKKL